MFITYVVVILFMGISAFFSPYLAFILIIWTLICTDVSPKMTYFEYGDLLRIVEIMVNKASPWLAKVSLSL